MRSVGSSQWILHYGQLEPDCPQVEQSDQNDPNYLGQPGQYQDAKSLGGAETVEDLDGFDEDDDDPGNSC